MPRQKCPLSLMELLTGGLAYHADQSRIVGEKYPPCLINHSSLHDCTLNLEFCSTRCKVEERTATSVTYTKNLELCLSAIPLWQRLLTPCDRGIEIDYNMLFCDLATQPYVVLNGYKSKWIYSSTSPLHTGKDP